ncbi:enoyl-CoA hydratase/isomerase family protein [Vibrio sp. TRT 21S02]|uniref:enoyl-CoA hydratase/isomerase family protein n=1 Tax=Vibrio sp. TRT 21S02 TaxID=3418507 RepID=UPI003CE850E5
MVDRVSFEERYCSDGQHKIGIATLDNATSLNALTLTMLKQLNEQLKAWEDDAHLVCVLMQGAGERAFCAGGDVRTMHNVMRDKTKQETQDFCTEFFTVEYECDYRIHTYSKPIIGWGDGIVMGGGMGLFMGTSHKIVTPASRLAMPEINIGLYPDVGGTWFLNQLDERVGLFLGLTGASVNACDALSINMADHFLLSEQKEELIKTLQGTHWNKKENAHLAVTEVIEALSRQFRDNVPVSQMTLYLPAIKQICSGEDLSVMCEQILSLKGDSKWLSQAKHTLAEGSAITAHICFRQVTRCHTLSLAECFQVELNLSVRSALLGEFQEGVRARLINKDDQPNWMFNSVNAVDEKVIDELFTSLWPEGEHPLKDLGQEAE